MNGYEFQFQLVFPSLVIWWNTKDNVTSYLFLKCFVCVWSSPFSNLFFSLDSYLQAQVLQRNSKQGKLKSKDLRLNQDMLCCSLYKRQLIISCHLANCFKNLWFSIAILSCSWLGGVWQEFARDSSWLSITDQHGIYRSSWRRKCIPKMGHLLVCLVSWWGWF